MSTPPVMPKPNILKRKAIELAKKISNLKTPKTKKKLENMSNNELAEYSGKITGNKTKKSNNKTSKLSITKEGTTQPVSPKKPEIPKQQDTPNESNNNEDNIKPIGSPGMYGMIVLGLFGFASYLQFSAFKDKQTFRN